MRYMLLICGDETAAEHADEGCGGWTEEMQASGVLVGGGGLHPPSDATTVRVREDAVLLTDGPFAETKEILGGYYLIDVADLDAALGWAAKMPNIEYGSVEVRPVVVFD